MNLYSILHIYTVTSLGFHRISYEINIMSPLYYVELFNQIKKKPKPMLHERLQPPPYLSLLAFN